MRGMRSLGLLAVVLIALGAYIYFVESKKPEGDTEAKPKVFSLNADAISEMSVTTAAGKTSLRKTGGRWEIVEPMTARADETEVSGIVTNLATVEAVRVVEENPKDLAQFGLADPHVDVAFTAGGDKQLRHLLIGDKTATGGEMYARVGGEKKVILIAAYLDSTFNKTTFDLRDKAVLAFERDKVDRLELASKDGTTKLSLANGEWTLVEPLRAPADYGSVEGVVGRLQSAQMKSIVAEEPSDADLATFGLGEPVLRAVVGAGSAQAALLLGKAADAEGTVYARDASRRMVFTVESTLVDDLKKPADQLRSKDLFASRAHNTTAVEVVRGGETIAFEKVKAAGKEAADKWRQTKPAAKDLDAGKVDGFLTALSNVRADSWLQPNAATKTALETTAMTVAVRFEDGKREERVVFGRTGPDAYASVPGQPGVAKVVASQFDEAVKALDALK